MVSRRSFALYDDELLMLGSRVEMLVMYNLEAVLEVALLYHIAMAFSLSDLSPLLQ